MNRERLFTIPIILITCLAIYSLLPTAYSLFPTPVLAQEEGDFDRINEIARKLNCPTCAGINLADCRTKTCEQWREQIGELVTEGYSDQEVLDYFSTRYGDQVLQEPPRSGFSLALWVLPVIGLVVGGVWLTFTLRKWRQQEPTPAAASTHEVSTTEPVPDFPDSDEDYLHQVDQDLGIDEE